MPKPARKDKAELAPVPSSPTSVRFKRDQPLTLRGVGNFQSIDLTRKEYEAAFELRARGAFLWVLYESRGKKLLECVPLAQCAQLSFDAGESRTIFGE